MKNLFKLSSLMALLLLVLASSCKDKEDVKPNAAKEFASFSLSASLNEGVEEDVEGVISGDKIVLKAPNTAILSALVPSFETSSERSIVTIGNQVQVSGESVVDLTAPVTYTITAEDNTTKNYTVEVVRSAAIISYGFYAADNPGVLFHDYEGTVNGTAISVEVPADAQITGLVARYETTAGATVQVNGVAQTSGEASNDFTSPVAYTVVDGEDSDVFTVTVGRLTAPVWSVIGNEGFLVPRTDGLVMAINPATHLPYLAFQIDGTINGESVPSEDEKIAVVAFNGAAWDYLGASTGFSEEKAEEISLAFDKDGKPYVAYKDYVDGKQAVTVQAYSGSNWTTVGSPQFSEGRSDYVSLGLAEDNTPYVAFSDRSQVTLPSRGLNIYGYSGSWVSNPPAGVLTSATKFVRKNGALYLAIMERTGEANKPSVYKLDNGAWAAVGTTQFSANGENGYISVDMDVAPDGTVYAAYQEYAANGRINYVMKYDGGSWSAIGEPVNVGSERDNFNIAVHPDGRLFFAYVDDAGLNIRTFNEATNNWNASQVLISGGVGEYDLQISAVGIPYVAAVLDDSDQTRVMKYDIP
ncbi:NHL repeat-containing protein [Pontibacter mangrovi]|uniref:DUF5018 domain-containing protein n=1 Tax=Pontibacter mangrovi TaxID=2589816 RepID=A0A501VY83_9BACT|nr:hypothetical protein [Pontibacter mangrovi]TPE42369.1 hypothetical protein FJM65_18230 [Pontibacter mangrovi]